MTSQYAEIQGYDLWARANDFLLERSSGVKRHQQQQQQQPVALVSTLQAHFADLAAGTMMSSNSNMATATTTTTGPSAGPQSLSDYLSSFLTINDNEDISVEQANEMIEKEISIRERIERRRGGGQLSAELRAIANRKPQQDYVPTGDAQNVLLGEVTKTAKRLANLWKTRRGTAHKAAKAVQRHWHAIRNQDERREREEKKRMMRLAKWTAQQIKRKWKIVERVCEERYKEIVKEKQAQEGRRHLEMILQHSEKVLSVRMEELSSRRNMVEDDDGKSGYSPPQDNAPAEPMDVDDDAGSHYSSSSASDATADHLILDEESEDDDDELRGLAEDQELDVEELLKKYNYRADSESSEEEEDDDNESVQESVSTKKRRVSSDTQLDVRIAEEDEETRRTINALDEEEPLADSGVSNEPVDQKAASPIERRDVDQAPVQVREDTAMAIATDQIEEADEDDGDTVTEYGTDVSDIEEEVKAAIAEAAKNGGGNAEEENNKQAAEDNCVESAAQEPTTSNAAETEATPTQQAQKAQQQQPTGTTLSTTKVDIKVPFLLRGTLREYQHVGLDWLASLYNNGLNGILADEMGLGKTIQTISLLAYLACEKGVWGPHLIVVPTSVLLNWEMEFKRWLPSFKILTYYGNPKERKEKRSGWSKENAFHVCITSYQLVLQDQNVFRRKAWQYLVLDEAHHIKNFRSQRWQTLLNFNSERRLLLTGTPLQNNLMELWSLLYFLMPNGVSQTMPIGFANQKEFQEWFSHPVDRMLEGGGQEDDEDSRAAIQKLHTVLRPYLLRRLKVDVEKQLPEKHEHIVYCRLSKRQRFLYDDFMSRAKTKETLASGNFLSIINCLMQLRKVCNHPDLFEERPITTSFAMDDDVQTVGQRIESLVNKYWRVPLDPENEWIYLWIPTTTASVPLMPYSRLDATKLFLQEIAKQESQISIFESRGITSTKSYHDLKKYAKSMEFVKLEGSKERWQSMLRLNILRCSKQPVLTAGLVDMCRSIMDGYQQKFFMGKGVVDCTSVHKAVLSYKDRVAQNMDIIDRYGFITPAVVVKQQHDGDKAHARTFSPDVPIEDILHPIRTRLSIAFPDKRLLQYDCGKLQKLDVLLRELAAGGHRALIFTQMTRVLDVLESFLNMHGHRYLRLDGATKIEQRQVLTEQFNNDKRILVFILSTRSGGLGINLTGADTVIFYDSDWNPSMDKQCQDRTHRIGQTRDVHIYRFVTEYTIEENIFKKANQKR